MLGNAALIEFRSRKSVNAADSDTGIQSPQRTELGLFSSLFVVGRINNKSI